MANNTDNLSINKARRLTVWLPEDLYLKVHTTAQKDDRSVTAVIKRLVKEHLQ